MYGAVDQRLAEFHAGIVEQVARREVIGAVDDHVDALQQALDIRRGHAFLDRLDAHARIERGERGARRFHFRRADARVDMQDLALQVAAVDDIVVGDAQRAHAGGRQVIRHRRTESARADDEHRRRFQAPLPDSPTSGRRRWRE
jgi:hypothetical protein